MAYMDIMDNNPNTNSFQDLLPPNHNYTDTQLKDLLRKRKDTYRRYRDLSIFAVIGVYLIFHHRRLCGCGTIEFRHITRPEYEGGTYYYK